MSSILEMLGEQLGGDTMKQLSAAIGADEAATEKGVAAALPVLLGAVARQAENEQGAAALHGAIEQEHDGGILDTLGDLFGGGQQQAQQAGGNILQQVLGGRQQRVETGISKTSGLSEAASGQLMKLLAPILMGAIGKQQRNQGVSAGGFGKWIGGEREQFERQSPQGGGLLGALLDTDGDGDVDMKDLLAHGSKLLFKR